MNVKNNDNMIQHALGKEFFSGLVEYSHIPNYIFFYTDNNLHTNVNCTLVLCLGRGEGEGREGEGGRIQVQI